MLGGRQGSMGTFIANGDEVYGDSTLYALHLPRYGTRLQLLWAPEMPRNLEVKVRPRIPCSAVRRELKSTLL